MLLFAAYLKKSVNFKIYKETCFHNYVNIKILIVNIFQNTKFPILNLVSKFQTK